MVKLTATSVLAGFIIFFSNITLYAQSAFWTQVPLPAIYRHITPYFLNENTGFVYDVPGTMQSNLRRTTDGGKTWTALRFFDNAKSIIRQIYFTSFTHGYAATSNGVYETMDQGDSWKSIFPDRSFAFSSVYAFGSKVYAFSFSNFNNNFENWGPLISSSDDGSTWDTIIPRTKYSVTWNPYLIIMKPYVFGNKDGAVFAENVTGQKTLGLLCSTNNGKDWSSNPMDVTDQTFTMGLFALPHCNGLLRTFLSFKSDPKSDVYQIAYSPDLGAHWNNIYFPIEAGAWIAGNNCVQYLSNATQGPGVLRSTDRGANWSGVNGPKFIEIDDEDFHNLSVVGGGAVVYAGDYLLSGGTGNLWKTTTGGDGTLSSSSFAPQISEKHELSPASGDTLKIKECDTGLVRMIFTNTSCNVAQFDKVTIDGLNSSDFTTQLIHHPFCDGLPDTLLIHIAGSSPGMRDLTVHARFTSDEYETLDTSFVFTFNVTSASGTSIYLKTSTISSAASDTTDIPLYITNVAPNPVTLGLDSIDLIYVLNTDVVTPFLFVPSLAGLRAGPVKTTGRTAAFTLYFPPGFVFTGETVLGKLRCEIYVSDTLETDIGLSGNASSSPCQGITSMSSVHFSLTSHCLDSSLSKFITYGAAYSLTSIIPNPARDEVRIELKNNGAELHYDLFDALGISRKSGMTDGNSLRLNISDVPAGNYYLRIVGEKGMPITKNLVIAK